MAGRKNGFTIIQGIILLTQVGFGVVTPLLLCIFGADYLMKRFAVGNWLMIAAILFGIGTGVYNAYSILRHALRQFHRDEEE